MPGVQNISLVVLSHGLWGNKNHMGYIENKLRDKYGDAIHIVKFFFSLKKNRVAYFFLFHIVKCCCQRSKIYL